MSRYRLPDSLGGVEIEAAETRLNAGRWSYQLADGATVYVGAPLVEVVPPAPPLPTVPGIYVDKDGDAWRLTEAGEWSTGGRMLDPTPYLPLTRYTPALEPVALPWSCRTTGGREVCVQGWVRPPGASGPGRVNLGGVGNIGQDDAREFARAILTATGDLS